MANSRLLGVGYLITIISLFLYSFTQVDLGLTLTKISIFQLAQKFFQSIGYFNRPLSTVFYLSIIFLLFLFYCLFLFLSTKNKISKKSVWILIIATAAILGFSYNAFSYDLFNYIFDAKIFTHYNQNPYQFKALDFPNDPMLSFMHWTHRLYPYGPVWLAVTIPLSFIGFQFFLPTFFLFKGLSILAYLGISYYLYKIASLNSKNSLFSLIFFALNPLVLIESLVSSHNDILMMFFAIFAFYCLLGKKTFWAFLFLFLSIGIKFATLILLPVFIAVFILRKNKKEIPWQRIWIISLVLMSITVFFASFRTNFQPWYLLFVLPFSAMAGKKYFIVLPVIIFTLFSLFQYAPFLYLGNWDNPVPLILLWLTRASFIVSLLLVLIGFFAFKGKMVE